MRSMWKAACVVLVYLSMVASSTAIWPFDFDLPSVAKKVRPSVVVVEAWSGCAAFTLTGRCVRAGTGICTPSRGLPTEAGLQKVSTGGQANRTAKARPLIG